MKNIRSDLKIIVVGNAGTGKTSFVNQWTKNSFSDHYKATIVSEFGYKIHEYKGRNYKIQIWDLAGQDKNIMMTRVFCKDAHGVIILSDITNSQTLNSCSMWKKIIDESVQFLDGTPLPMMLIQNKIDLLSEEDQLIELENLNEFYAKNGFTFGYQTSVKFKLNINESMDEFLSYVIDKTETVYLNQETKQSIILSEKENKSKINVKKNCC